MSAKSTLKHYLRMAVEANGAQWSWENDNEVDAIVDAIVNEAVSKTIAQIKAKENEEWAVVDGVNQRVR